MGNSRAGKSLLKQDSFPITNLAPKNLNLLVKSVLPPYVVNMRCKNCHTEIALHKKFCNNSCSAKFNNSRRPPRTEESRLALSKKLKFLITSGVLPKPKYPSVLGLRWGKKSFDEDLYRQACIFYTPYRILVNIEGFELINEFGWFHPINNIEGVSRDHMFSIAEGWKQRIPSQIIAHPANCKIIRIRENKSKGSSCSISLQQLFERVNDWELRFPFKYSLRSSAGQSDPLLSDRSEV